MVSLAKVLIAMETNKVPANLHFDKPNPNIAPLVEGRMKVVTESISWNGKYAAINSVGMSSSHGHILLKANSKVEEEVECKFSYMVPVSTSTETGITAMINMVSSISRLIRLGNFVPLFQIESQKFNTEYLTLVQGFFSKVIPKHIWRGYTIIHKDRGEIKREFEVSVLRSSALLEQFKFCSISRERSGKYGTCTPAWAVNGAKWRRI